MILKKCGKKNIAILIINIFVFLVILQLFLHQNTTESVDEVNDMIIDVLHKSKVPGASVVIVDQDSTKYLNYGYVDESMQEAITEDTLFELGSLSKSYTALGILWLEKEGLLSLEDSVRDYLPWLTVQYKDKTGEYSDDEIIDLKLYHFLYHTSGIPYHTIGYIPAGNSPDMLEKTISNLKGITLDFYPGTKYKYTTINYDVLALVIETITGQAFEDFMQETILAPLKLDDTYMNRNDPNVLQRIATGYKINFFSSKPYNAPFYRGNIAAGYIVSNNKDMERWMRIQMGLLQDVPNSFSDLITRSHTGDISVPAHTGDTSIIPDGYYFYAGGWEVQISGDTIRHGGSNPNYSTMLIMKPKIELGVCVMTNMNSDAASYIAQNIINIYMNKNTVEFKNDLFKNLDTIFTLIFLSAVCLILVYIILLIISVYQIIRKVRKYSGSMGSMLANVLMTILMLLFSGFCIYYLPNVLMDRLPWSTINIWGSKSIELGCIWGYIAFGLFMLYVLIMEIFPKKNHPDYLTLIFLSILNGLTSAMIIFCINESFNRNLEYSKELLVYFVFALMMFVYTLKIMNSSLIILSNELIYEKRLTIIQKVLNTTLRNIEQIGQERLYSGINNDTGMVAQFPEIIVGMASSLITIIFCLLYLASKSLLVFIVSMGIIAINGLISILTGKIATKYWEKNRKIQDIYFSQMSDLVYGIKELILNKLRRFDFWNEVKHYSRLSTEQNKKAAFQFLYFDLYNTLMYNIIFGVVVFVFPILFISISVNELRDHLFIVFYMIGPFNNLVSNISRFMQLKVNLKKINVLIDDLEKVSAEERLLDDEQKLSFATENPIVESPDIELQFENIYFNYKMENTNDMFTLGPLSLSIKTGEILFIIGGNGSGKSTLAKLLTGLYQPQQGSILLNGKIANSNDLIHLFSAVYSDYHLFKKLYGIEYQKRKTEIQHLLETMKIDSQIKIDPEGIIESIDLSSGQKKRLAFVITCLENKPILLFDEWAAEQDPEFKDFFYQELLPALKQKGKGVVIISHDDRYFHIADKIIKLERGVML